MAYPSYTYTLANSTTADATQVMQDFTDILNGVKDGTKDHNIAALTCAGTATFNGNVTLGDSSADTVTWTASLASSIPIGTTYSYDIGAATLGLKRVYLGSNDSAARSVGVRAGVVTASYVIDLPPAVPANNNSVIEFTTAGLGAFRQIKAPTIQSFTTGTSQTYTKPANVLYLRVRMVGGGGGGGGSGTTNGTAATDGGASSFTDGTVTLTANGGTKGARNTDGAAGGTASIVGAAASGIAIAGGNGLSQPSCGSALTAASPSLPGGAGGASYFGGAGAGGGTVITAAGIDAVTNSGSGGGGAGVGNGTNSNVGGSGGGAGGFIDVIITGTLSSTYTYSVGAKGTQQAGGTSGTHGGDGGAGYIEVTEYYQ